MPSSLTRLCCATTIPALLAAASLGVLIVATTSAEARVGVGRPGIGVGRVGSGLGVRPGVGVGRAGLGVRGWRNGVGYGRRGYRGYGYGAAALTGAALGYAAGNYGYGYEEPSGYGYTGLYSYAPTNYAVSTPAPAAPTGGGYALVQFTGGHCEVWSNGNPSGSGWTMLVDGLPSWDAGEAAYHTARAQGICQG
jgi:hypothetical protein